MPLIRTGSNAGKYSLMNTFISGDATKEGLPPFCDDHLLYPCNLKRSLALEYTLELYYRKLQEESERLFNPTPRSKLLKFWETNKTCDSKYLPVILSSVLLRTVANYITVFEEYKPLELTDLKGHCQRSSLQDPACRYV